MNLWVTFVLAGYNIGLDWTSFYWSITVILAKKLIALSFFLTDNVKNSGGRVLVHCQAGISRSATICLAYLIGRLRFRLDEAYEFVKKRRSIISPNFNFMGQLLKWESVNQSTRRVDELKTPVSSSNYGFFNFSSLPCGSEIVPNSRSPGLVTTPI